MKSPAGCGFEPAERHAIIGRLDERVRGLTRAKRRKGGARARRGGAL